MSADNAAQPVEDAAAGGAEGAEDGGDALAAIKALKLIDKCKGGNYHLIAESDMDELFKILDPTETGVISTDSLLVIRLAGVIIPDDVFDALCKDSDTGNGECSKVSLLKAMTRGDFAFHLVKSSLLTNANESSNTCQRQDLINWAQFTYTRSTALWSLPMTFLTYMSFVLAMAAHLQIEAAYWQSTVMTNEWANLPPPWSILQGAVTNIPNFWFFMVGSYPPTYLQQTTSVDANPGRIAHYYQIVGGFEITKHVTETAPCHSAKVLAHIYDTQAGECWYQGKGSHDERLFFSYHLNAGGDLTTMLNNYTNANWLDETANLVTVTTLVFNAANGLFTLEEFLVPFDPSGLVLPVTIRESFKLLPYAGPLDFVLDIIFVCCLLKLIVSEAQQMIPACMMGLQAFLGYLQFWNLVDWCSVLIGIVIYVIWGIIVLSINGPLMKTLEVLPAPTLDNLMQQNNMSYLTLDQIDQAVGYDTYSHQMFAVYDEAKAIAHLQSWLRLLICVYNFVLMMKFFKGLRANPRLNLTLGTLVGCTTDMAHFGLVYITVFTVFGYSGYVLYAPTDPTQSSLGIAMLTLWFNPPAVGIMENTIYEGLAEMRSCIYLFLMLLLMLNMVLGILISSYVRVCEGMAKDNVTIWAQVRNEVDVIRETRGFKDMWALICEFNDQVFPAHPAPLVTSRTLRKAFERDKMSKQNADYLIKQTVDWTTNQQESTTLSMADSMRVLSQVRNTCFRTERLLESIFLPEDNAGRSGGGSSAQGDGRSGAMVAMAAAGVGEVSGGDNEPPMQQSTTKIIAERLQEAMQNFEAMEVEQEQLRTNLMHKLEQHRTLHEERSQWLMGQLQYYEKRLERAQSAAGRLSEWLGGVSLRSLQNLPEIMDEVRKGLPMIAESALEVADFGDEDDIDNGYGDDDGDDDESEEGPAFTTHQKAIPQRKLRVFTDRQTVHREAVTRLKLTDEDGTGGKKPGLKRGNTSRSLDQPTLQMQRSRTMPLEDALREPLDDLRELAVADGDEDAGTGPDTSLVVTDYDEGGNSPTTLKSRRASTGASSRMQLSHRFGTQATPTGGIHRTNSMEEFGDCGPLPFTPETAESINPTRRLFDEDGHTPSLSKTSDGSRSRQVRIGGVRVPGRGSEAAEQSAHIAELESKLNDIAEKVNYLTTLPDENLDIRKTLWKIQKTLQDFGAQAAGASQAATPAPAPAPAPSRQQTGARRK